MIGVLNAAPMPAAAPTGAIRRMWSRVRWKSLPSSEAIPAPICSAGSSGPIGLPEPIESVLLKNLPMTLLNGT